MPLLAKADSLLWAKKLDRKESASTEFHRIPIHNFHHAFPQILVCLSKVLTKYSILAYMVWYI